MRIERMRAVLALCLSFALSGCFAYSPRIKKREPVNPEAAYLYGRFEIDATTKTLSLEGYPTMGFGLTCRAGEAKKEYAIRFVQEENPVQAIKIKPGECTLREFLYTSADGTLLGRKPTPVGLMQNVVFEPGKAYYLGDFKAHATMYGNSFSWDLDGAWDNYDVTTQELRSNFPNFVTLPTENRMMGKQ